MSISSWISLGGFLVTVAVIVWHAGRTSQKNEQTRRQAKEWADGIGNLYRRLDSKQERRWKHLIAMQIESADTAEQRQKIAKLLREDAWRD